MKYLSVRPIVRALHRIHDGDCTHEHRTGTATSGLLENYFPLNKNFITTPEQIQIISNKKPDFTVEKLLDDDRFMPHVFVEIKSLINSNFENIMDQLELTILHAVDSSGLGLDGSFSVFVIAMKASKIAFLEYHSCVDILTNGNIPNYKGFVPLGYTIPAEVYFDVNYRASVEDYIHHFLKVTDLPRDPHILIELGVESTSKIQHPHI